MKNNSFIWTDLSTYFPQQSISFYQAVFDWQVQNSDGYFVAHRGNDEIAGIYETPDFFKQINMPHFWMNYIQVSNLEKVVDTAEQHGGKIEIREAPFYGGKIALIRDPKGAGFTIYEGSLLRQPDSNTPDTVIGRELHVSDASAVIDFYQKLFNWNFQQGNYKEQFYISSDTGKPVATMLELDNSIKGKYEYWVTTFGVANILATQQAILDNGGHLISDEGHRKMFTDSFGEAFFYIEGI